MKEDARVYGRGESSFEVKGKILPERGLDGDGEIGGDGKRWLLECAFNVEVSVTLEESPGSPVLCDILLRRLWWSLVLLCIIKLHGCE